MLPLRVAILAIAVSVSGVPAFAAETPAADAPASLAAPLTAATASNQRLAPLIQRFTADLSSITHVHDVPWGTKRQSQLDRFYHDWQTRLTELPDDGLGLEDRIDVALFQRELARRRDDIATEQQRFREAAPLLPDISILLDLMEAQRALAYADGRQSADAFEHARQALSAKLDALQKEGKDAAPGVSAITAFRAARILDSTREQLKQWQTFYADYDPTVSWWIGQPYAALDKVMVDYAAALRDKLAGASDPETIIGEPIGRAALVRGLAGEMIDYSPEELLQLAENELAWCQTEMTRAAKELGYSDWHQALEYVKTRHPAPGEQPRLVVELADEAIHFIEDRQLITVPELAKRDWRMTMLTPEYQLQAPFFLGGEDVWVAYPTAGMPHDKKLMALRGNNRYFSRAVVHHELIPGHHLQHYYNSRYQTQRELFQTPFWTEGWALYWEFRLWDLGFAKTPEERIGMLFWRSHRAARILFSLGFHLGKMTPDQAVDLLVDRVGHERENARAEVRRSFAGDYGPLYQIAYMIGGLQFQALQQEIVGGGRMSERAFHDAILEGGPMPVELVRARLLGQPPARDYTASWRFYNRR